MKIYRLTEKHSTVCMIVKNNKYQKECHNAIKSLEIEKRK
jgi:hypothetical protein